MLQSRCSKSNKSPEQTMKMKEMKSNLPLGVASTLRRVKGNAPALQSKAGALLLVRRSLDTTPSEGMRPVYQALQGRNPAVQTGKKQLHSVFFLPHCVRRNIHSVFFLSHCVRRNIHSVVFPPHCVRRNIHNVFFLSHSVGRNIHSVWEVFPREEKSALNFISLNL
jgi:hypothetical protein